MMLSQSQKDRFWRDGSLIAEDATAPEFFRLQVTAKAAM